MHHHSYINPVHRRYFADPHVWRCGSQFHAIGTGPGEAGGTVARSRQPTIFPLLRSPDLVSWHDAGRALVRPEESLGDTFWAPEVAFADRQWFLYYSVGHSDRLHQLRVATSDEPLGPYRDCAGLTDLAECPFAIDPHPFRDEDGRWYLFHARDFLDGGDRDGVEGERSDAAGRPVRAGTALVVHPLVGMTALSPEGRTVARARCDWQRFAANRPMYGRIFDWHTLEGPCVIRHAGRYFCFYSGGCWQNDTYGVDYVVSDAVLGPYSDAGVETGPRVLRTVPGRVLGPGHCSIVTGPDEVTSYLVYHAWGPEMRARRMCIDQLVFTPDGPRSPGPTWTETALAGRVPPDR